MRSALRRVLRFVFPTLMHHRALSHREWSEIEEDLLPAVVPPGRGAVDVGAHVGSYTVALARLARQVFAFEPDEEMYELLRRAAPRNVEVSNDALSDTPGYKDFRVPLIDGGQRAVTLGSLESSGTGPVEVRRVVTSVLDRLQGNDIGFIKIDVEGHEAEVLAGGRRLLDQQQPVVLVEANDLNAVRALEEFFRPRHYVGFFVLDGRTHPLTQFTSDLQDRLELERPVPRRAMRFVNNFFFVPQEMEAGCRRRIDAALDRLGNLPVQRPSLAGQGRQRLRRRRSSC